MKKSNPNPKPKLILDNKKNLNLSSSIASSSLYRWPKRRNAKIILKWYQVKKSAGENGNNLNKQFLRS